MSQSNLNKNQLLTKDGLREALGLRSTRIIDSWIRKKMIPVINAGWRTKLFDLARVKAALEKFEIKEAGRK